MHFYLYVHTNRINGKKYVGITRQTPEKRGSKGRGYSSQKKFYSAILKYGWDNFDHQVGELGSEKDMLYGEKYLIQFYNTINRGYNVVPGGMRGYKRPKHHSDIPYIGYCNTKKEYQKGYNKGTNNPLSDGIRMNFFTYDEQIKIAHNEISPKEAGVIYLERISDLI